MSYADMDHADWVQNQINLAIAHPPRCQSGRKRQKDGVGWEGAPEKLAVWQKQLFNILGIAGAGIYNAPIGWTNLQWNYGNGISLTWRNSMSTFDFPELTFIVFGCHDARIRFTVEGAARAFLRLSFWPREPEGNLSRRHPNLD